MRRSSRSLIRSVSGVPSRGSPSSNSASMARESAPLRERRPSLDRIQVLGDLVDHPMSCLMKLFRVHQRSSIIRSVATMRPLSGGCTGRLLPWMIARNL